MSLFNKIIKKLIKKNITISVAESCTGGLISETITQYSGVSKIFSVGIVCYSNKAKMKYLSANSSPGVIYLEISTFFNPQMKILSPVILKYPRPPLQSTKCFPPDSCPRNQP